MKTLSKKCFLPIILVISLLLTFMTVPASATSQSQENMISETLESTHVDMDEYLSPSQSQVNELTDEDWDIIDEITHTGVISFDQAYQILRVDKITKKLEQYNQEVTSVNNQIVVVPDANGINHLSSEETNYIINALSLEAQKINEDRENIISREEALVILQAEIEEYPEQTIYSVDMGAGRTLWL